MSEPLFHQFKLRLPVNLFQRLEAQAGITNRSVSAEIITRLEESFEKPKVTLTSDQVRDLAGEFMSIFKMEVSKAEKLQADDLDSLFKKMEQRYLEEADVLASLTVAAEQEAYAIRSIEGHSARYETAQQKLRKLRWFQNQVQHRGQLLIEAGLQLSDLPDSDSDELEIRPTPKKKAKRHG
ncbi:hypothetical protein HDC36_003404 [Xanthomonas sp. JAI131]|uniref:Arc family DNA-binding protein n=1 Tax=Xanthomonas sp. JAI131 TaxID=2723067 RepID=UPI0015C9B057|nr:Arc family DNA-binding protein [Xanthomonas sp. JAI131]NYF21928.1 hypothetical protein [Xanthomonas sp. JAI131]